MSFQFSLSHRLPREVLDSWHIPCLIKVVTRAWAGIDRARDTPCLSLGAPRRDELSIASLYIELFMPNLGYSVKFGAAMVVEVFKMEAE